MKRRCSNARQRHDGVADPEVRAHAAAGWRAALRRLFMRMAAFVLLVAALAVQATPEKRQPGAFQSMLTKVVAHLISSRHYTSNTLDEDISRQLFNEYFDALDRDRRFFLAQDIEDFSEYRTKLHKSLLSGETDFAYDVYERFLERVRERVAFARERLRQPFDFEREESLLTDRSEKPWCETPEDLDELWRKRLKNKVLNYKLMESTEASGAEDEEKTGTTDPEDAAAENGADGTPAEQRDEHAGEPLADSERAAPADEQEGNGRDEPELSPLTSRTPKERALQAVERYLTYLEENDKMDILEIYLSSLARIYDPHSAYMAPTTEEDFDINMSLSLEGIGAVLTTEEGYVKVVRIIPGGPADQDGQLHAGDRIVAVAQDKEKPVDVIDMPLRKVVRMIRGPKGTTVHLRIIEAGKGASGIPSRIDIVRDEVELKGQEAKSDIRTLTLPEQVEEIPPPNDSRPETAAADAEKRDVMVVRVPSFYADFQGKNAGQKDYKRVSTDLRQILGEAAEKEVAGMILDLRSNGGGSLEEAIQVAGLFFAKGPVVQVRDARGRTLVHRDRDEATVYGGPLVVLVNRLSASASEIVSAALQDHGRAVIIGESSTHGKGTVQTVRRLDPVFDRYPVLKDKEAGSLKYTIAKFYRVNGGSVQLRGVTPDITFPSFRDHMDLGEASLDHALRWDQIEPLNMVWENDVRPHLPVLKKRAKARLEDSKAFAERMEAINEFADIQAREKLTLNLEERRDLQEEDDKWMERVRKTARRESREDTADTDPSDQTESPGDGGEEDDATDLIMEEALNTLADLIRLQQEQHVAAAARETADSSADTDSGVAEKAQ